MSIKLIIKYLLVIACMVTIFCFSNQKSEDSTKLSTGVIEKIVTTISKNIDEADVEEIVDKYFVFVRKTAHFLIYLTLGILVANLIIEYQIEFKKVILISLFICFIYACSDEIHQIFVSGRSCELMDILIDSTGALFGIIGYTKIKRITNVTIVKTKV